MEDVFALQEGSLLTKTEGTSRTEAGRISFMK